MIVVYRNTNSDSSAEPLGNQYLQRFKWATCCMPLCRAHAQADEPP